MDNKIAPDGKLWNDHCIHQIIFDKEQNTCVYIIVLKVALKGPWVILPSRLFWKFCLYFVSWQYSTSVKNIAYQAINNIDS